MKKKTQTLAGLFLAAAVVALMMPSCKDDINGDYYPPVLKLGFEDTSEIVIDNSESNPGGGPDSSYVRVIKLVSNTTNNAIGIDCFFNLVKVDNPADLDTTAYNVYFRMLNPIVRMDSLNADGSLFRRNMWVCARASFALAQRSAAIQMRSIDFVEGVPKTGSPASHEFLLQILPDRNNPIRYTVDEARSAKKVKVVDGKQLTAPVSH